MEATCGEGRASPAILAKGTISAVSSAVLFEGRKPLDWTENLLFFFLGKLAFHSGGIEAISRRCQGGARLN